MTGVQSRNQAIQSNRNLLLEIHWFSIHLRIIKKIEEAEKMSKN